MADFKYNVFKAGVMRGEFDLQEAGDDIRVLLLEANSDVNPDDLTISAVLARAGTTELTNTGYARQALASQAVTQDDTNDRGLFDAEDETFPSVGAGNDAVAAIVYKHVTDDTDSVPMSHIDSGFPVTPNGSDITITWDPDGISAIT